MKAGILKRKSNAVNESVSIESGKAVATVKEKSKSIFFGATTVPDPETALSMATQHRRQPTERPRESQAYSPVSNCITTDASKTYEKKRQRMEKIRQMRGISSQSAALSSDI